MPQSKKKNSKLRLIKSYLRLIMTKWIDDFLDNQSGFAIVSIGKKFFRKNQL